METEYIYIAIAIFSLIVGLLLGVQVVKFFSSELIFKLEGSLERQLKTNENYLNEAIQILINRVNQKVDFIEKINHALKNTQEYLNQNSKKIEVLNANCDTRKELESEIVKLKKIIQRMEKKR